MPSALMFERNSSSGELKAPAVPAPARAVSPRAAVATAVAANVVTSCAANIPGLLDVDFPALCRSTSASGGALDGFLGNSWRRYQRCVSAVSADVVPPLMQLFEVVALRVGQQEVGILGPRDVGVAVVRAARHLA